MAPDLQPPSVRLRRFRPTDAPQVARLFYDTVHSVNARDYDPAQLDAWAPDVGDDDYDGDDEGHASSHSGSRGAAYWAGRLNESLAYVAEADSGSILGFGDLTPAGVLDHLYVHKDYQGQSVGTLLAERLEAEARTAGLTEVVAEVSITARPFFAGRGYELVRPQQKPHGGAVFLNYIMRKLL